MEPNELQLDESQKNYIRLKCISLDADREGVFRRIASNLELVPDCDTPLTPSQEAIVEAAIAACLAACQREE